MSDVGLGMRFALAALGTWRVTHLLAREDGPGDAVLRIRARAGSGAVGDLMDCFYCLSVWVAAPFAVAIAPRRRDVPLACLALSGAACLLERIVPADAPAPAVELQTRGEKGVADGLLWSETTGA